MMNLVKGMVGKNNKNPWPRVLQIMGIFIFIFTFIWGKGTILLFLLCAALLGLGEYFFSFHRQSLNPYLMMFLSPLLLIHYSSISDFSLRLACFLFFILVIAGAYRQGKTKITFSLSTSKPHIIWLTAFLIFALSAFILFYQGVHLSGDEPHYIMMAQSMVEDGDFNLLNNINEETYRTYLPVKIRSHGIFHDNKLLPYHMPGLSFLLIPFYLLFKLTHPLIPAALFFRLAAAVINAFFALGFFYILKYKFPQKNISPFWLFYLTVFPLFFHAIHLYPELPAAALMIFAILFGFHGKKNYLLCGLSLSLIPWFHLKYIPPLLFLTLVVVYSIHKGKRKKDYLHFFCFPLVGLVLLILFSKILYGTFNPATVFPKANYFSLPWWPKVKTLFAFFLDQRDGLLFYSPIIFLSFLGFKKKNKGRIYLAMIVLFYILFHAFTTIRGAYSPAGRPLIFIFWILAIFILDYYYQAKAKKSNLVFKLLAGFNLFIMAWLIYYPFFIYQPVYARTVTESSALLNFFSNSHLNLSSLFPSFLSSATQTHPASIFWIILLGAIIIFFYLKPLKISPLIRQKILPPIMFFLLILMFCYFPRVRLLPANLIDTGQISLYNHSRNCRFSPQTQTFTIKGGHHYHLYLKPLPAAGQKINFFLTPTDSIEVTIYNGRHLLYRSHKNKESSFGIDTAKLKWFKVKGKKVIHIGIDTRTADKESFLKLKITAQPDIDALNH